MMVPEVFHPLKTTEPPSFAVIVTPIASPVTMLFVIVPVAKQGEFLNVTVPDNENIPWMSGPDRVVIMLTGTDSPELDKNVPVMVAL